MTSLPWNHTTGDDAEAEAEADMDSVVEADTDSVAEADTDWPGPVPMASNTAPPERSLQHVLA